MTADERRAAIQEIFDTVITEFSSSRMGRILTSVEELLDKKGRDYGGELDVNSNLREYGAFGISVRISDKLSRVKNLTLSGRTYIEDEKLRQEFIDIIGYAALAVILLDEANPPMGGQLQQGG